MLCNAYDDMSGFSILNTRGVTIGRSHVSEKDLDDYVVQGLLKSLLHGLCHALGREQVPRPEPYEVIVFHDFFEAGLQFPCEDFVGEVLQCFNLHIHHLIPNVFT